VPWPGAWWTGNWEQGISCSTTATPKNRVTPWEIARPGTCHTLREPQLTTRFGRKTPRRGQMSAVGGTRNAAPLRAGWRLRHCGRSHHSTDEQAPILTKVTLSYRTSSPTLNNQSESWSGVHAGSNRVTRKPRGPSPIDQFLRCEADHSLSRRTGKPSLQ
jgi:hypothetical protein